MTVREYEEQAAVTATYAEGSVYPYLGLVEEVGEVAGVLAKAERDNDGVLDDARREQLQKELGDVLWMIAAVARDDGALISSVHKSFPMGAGPVHWKAPEPALAVLAAAANLALNNWAAGVSAHGNAMTASFEWWADLCRRLGFEPVDVAAANLAKLASRQARGKLQGAGDDR